MISALFSISQVFCVAYAPRSLPWSWFMASALVDLFWPGPLGSTFGMSVPDGVDMGDLVGFVGGDTDIAATVIAGTRLRGNGAASRGQVSAN
jgi:hypothetical protein